MNLDAITSLLRRADSGDDRAQEELQTVLYTELRTHAHDLMRRQRPGATLQATALVHEAWMKLVRHPDAAWCDRNHFVRSAARAMRQVLVDQSRARKARKRPGDRARLEFDDALAIYEDRSTDLVELNAALERLADFDEQLARLVDLRFFAGLSIAETAEALGVSHATVERGWRTARTWLKSQL